MEKKQQNFQKISFSPFSSISCVDYDFANICTVFGIQYMAFYEFKMYFFPCKPI